MAKFSGKIGFAQTIETSPGIWECAEPIERHYRGDLTRSIFRWEDKTKINSNITLNQDLSIVADPYALKNLGNIRYAVINGVAWEITSFEINHPRITLHVGGVYNGETAN